MNTKNINYSIINTLHNSPHQMYIHVSVSSNPQNTPETISLGQRLTLLSNLLFFILCRPSKFSNFFKHLKEFHGESPLINIQTSSAISLLVNRQSLKVISCTFFMVSSAVMLGHSVYSSWLFVEIYKSLVNFYLTYSLLKQAISYISKTLLYCFILIPIHNAKSVIHFFLKK